MRTNKLTLFFPESKLFPDVLFRVKIWLLWERDPNNGGLEKMKLLSLCIKVWVRQPGPVGGTTINRDPHPFHLVARSPSAQNLHLTAQNGCPSSCQHIHIMAHGKGSLEGSGVLPPLKCTTQKRHQKIH